MSQRRAYPFRIGHWLPEDPKVVEVWLKKLREKVLTEPVLAELAAGQVIAFLDPVIVEFKRDIESDATLQMQYTQMFTEASKSQVKTYNEMFVLVDYIMKNYTPVYSTKALVGFPINAILNWAMETTNGYAAFLNKRANGHWKKVLDKWQNEVLKTEKSVHVLNYDKETGWLGEEAMKAMTEDHDLKKFVELFECNPEDPLGHLGFTSWDNFFTRRFREGARPIEDYANPAVINNACESFPYSLRKKVELADDFWIKNHKYSLKYMLNDEELAKRFVGGTVYQAFLSALSYHRWHSPIKGTVIKTEVIPGTYYSATLCVGPDEASPDKSQGYICQVAARALIVIRADNPKIGIMCVLAVGMAEVSTCEITVQIGNQVDKGQEIGMFHFGGSTHCLIFRPGVNLRFIDRVYKDLDPKGDNDSEYNIHVNAKLASVV